MKYLISFICILSVLFSNCGYLAQEDFLRHQTVQLIGNGISCSGEQIKAPSGIRYILTAAHCKGTAVDGSILVKTEDGRELQRRIIAEDPKSDLMLLEGVPNLKGLNIAKARYFGQKVRTFTHGRGLATYKTEGFLIQKMLVVIPIHAIESQKERDECSSEKYKIQSVPSFFGMVEVCVMAVEEELMTAMVVPGSSGGMVVNDAGELVGVVSARDEFFGLNVPLEQIKAFIKNY